MIVVVEDVEKLEHLYTVSCYFANQKWLRVDAELNVLNTHTKPNQKRRRDTRKLSSYLTCACPDYGDGYYKVAQLTRWCTLHVFSYL